MGVGLLVFAPPARAADENLAQLPGAVGLSAHAGWVAYSAPVGTDAWSLRTWHRGVVADVGVAARDAPFDVNVGPDASGHPTAVYSRCLRSGRGERPPVACDLFAVRLDDGSRERRLAVSSHRASEFSPAIWRTAVAFGRKVRGRRSELVLARAGKRPLRLRTGTFPICDGAFLCEGRPRAWTRRTDLGSQAVAFEWTMRGGSAFLGSGDEVRIVRRSGGRSRLAQAGWSGGACEGTAAFSPNVSRTTVLFAYHGAACGEGADSIRRFELGSVRRFQSLVSPESGREIVSLAEDAGDLYWLRADFFQGDCITPTAPCELIRSRGLAFERIKGGEDSPPLD